jgi:hypothetical protein
MMVMVVFSAGAAADELPEVAALPAELAEPGLPHPEKADKRTKAEQRTLKNRFIFSTPSYKVLVFHLPGTALLYRNCGRNIIKL